MAPTIATDQLIQTIATDQLIQDLKKKQKDCITLIILITLITLILSCIMLENDTPQDF